MCACMFPTQYVRSAGFSSAGGEIILYSYECGAHISKFQTYLPDSAAHDIMWHQPAGRNMQRPSFSEAINL